MNYHQALLDLIKEWNRDKLKDEWILDTFREQFINPLSSNEAFGLIDETVDVLLTYHDEHTSIAIIETILALARKSNTTEIPIKLLNRKNLIVDQFAHFGDYAKNQLKELFLWYRI